MSVHIFTKRILIFTKRLEKAFQPIYICIRKSNGKTNN